jgi:hypothetical protein
MKIVISVESLDPPTGRVSCRAGGRPVLGGSDEGVEFAGWLGLLRILDDLIGEPSGPAGPG